MRAKVKKQTRKLFLFVIFLFSSSYLFSSFFIAPYKEEIVFSTYFQFALDLIFPEDNSCYLDPDGISVESRNFSDNTIFFIETSCKRGLTLRKACALEAAANAHPLKTIVLLSTSALKKYAYRSVLEEFNIQNLIIHRIHIVEYTKGTPLEDVFNKRLKRLMTNRKIIAELLKFITLYKFGGTVLDLDLIVTRRLDKYYNWFIKEKDETLHSSVMGLQRDVGKKSFEGILNLLRDQKYLNVSSSQLALNAAFKRLCYTEYTINKNFCDEFHIFDSGYFFPINRANKELYYRPGNLLEESRVYGYFMWDSTDRRRYVDHDSLFVKITRKYCPSVYKSHIVHFVRY